MKGVTIKTAAEIKIMAEGGARLARVREALVRAVGIGVTGLDLEKSANRLILAEGGTPSFAMVPGYVHATCINVNDVVVHGIPTDYKFKVGDKVGFDVGMYYKGFHTDTSTTVAVGSKTHAVDAKMLRFLEAGRRALKRGIDQARVGKRILDISQAVQEEIEGAGYGAVRALTGHGVGRELHEEPAIPCFVMGSYNHSPKITVGMVLAIEVMYNEGTYEVAYKNTNGWTIVTADGKISGLLEETVAVTPNGPIVLTKLKK